MSQRQPPQVSPSPPQGERCQRALDVDVLRTNVRAVVLLAAPRQLISRRNLPASTDRIDVVHLGVADLRRVVLSMPPQSDDSSYGLREIEVRGAATDGSRCGAGRQTPGNTSRAMIEALGPSVVRNCTSTGGVSFSWTTILQTATPVFGSYVVLLLVLWLAYVFRHNLRAYCRYLEDRRGEQASMRRASSRASYVARLEPARVKHENAFWALVSSARLESWRPEAPAMSLEVAPRPRSSSGAYGRGLPILALDTLSDGIKVKILSWIDCVELARLSRVCRWWRRLHVDAGCWASIPAASYSGTKGIAWLAKFPNLHCIEISPEQAKLASSVLPGRSRKMGVTDTARLSLRRRAAGFLPLRFAPPAENTPMTFQLTASLLEVEGLRSFRLLNCKARRDIGSGALWELSEDFLQHLCSRHCRLSFLSLAGSDFNGELRELRELRELSLRKVRKPILAPFAAQSLIAVLLSSAGI